MVRLALMVGLAACATMSTGCRCFPGFNCYADFIDDVSDQEIVWDQWYCPRLDISRAGRPDWCGPVNRRLAPCRCDCTGTWKRADECWRYPSGYPYWYPARTVGITTFESTAATAAPLTGPDGSPIAPPPVPPAPVDPTTAPAIMPPAPAGTAPGPVSSDIILPPPPEPRAD